MASAASPRSAPASRHSRPAGALPRRGAWRRRCGRGLKSAPGPRRPRVQRPRGGPRGARRDERRRTEVIRPRRVRGYTFFESRPGAPGVRSVGGPNPMTQPDPHPTLNAESERLRQSAERSTHWKRWGPYLSERQWATVREDYSAHGTAWEHFPHDHARSRAYRWGEDGLLGISDNHQ